MTVEKDCCAAGENTVCSTEQAKYADTSDHATTRAVPTLPRSPIWRRKR